MIKKRRMAALPAALAAALLVCMPVPAGEAATEGAQTEVSFEGVTAAEPYQFSAGEEAFEEITLLEEGKCILSVSSSDADITDGYALTFHMENQSENEFAVELSDFTVNDAMCDAQETGGASWIVKAGSEEDDAVSWSREQLQRSGIGSIRQISFRISAKQLAVEEQTQQSLFDERCSLEISGKTAFEQDLSVSREDAVTLADEDGILVQILSFEKDEYDQMVWRTYLENHTEETICVSIRDAVLDDYATECGWSRRLLPGTYAYSDISWWNMDTLDNGIFQVENARFNLDIRPDKDSAGAMEPKSIPCLITPVLHEDGQTGAPDAAEPAGAAEEESEAGTGNEESMTEFIPDGGNIAEGTEPVSEEEPEADREEQPEGQILWDNEDFVLVLTETQTGLDKSFYSMRFWMQNRSDSDLDLIISPVTYNDYVRDSGWKRHLPADSRKISELNVDRSELSEHGVGALEQVRFTVRLQKDGMPGERRKIALNVDGEEGNELILEDISSDETGPAEEEGTDGQPEEETAGQHEEAALGQPEEDITESPEEAVKEPAEENAGGQPEEDITESPEEAVTEPAEENAGGQPEEDITESPEEGVTEPAEENAGGQSEEDITETPEEAVTEPAEENAGGQPDEPGSYEDAGTIRLVQSALKAEGYGVSEVNGIMDDALREAIRTYRGNHGLTDGRYIDDRMLYTMGLTDGITLKKLQELLIEEGYDCGSADGMMGGTTRKAISAWRADHGQGDAGYVDKQLLISFGLREDDNS